MPTSNGIRKFITLSKEADTIALSDLDWELKYNLIFSDDISREMYNLDLVPEYYDPDSSYEDDVLAFVRAVTERAKQLELFITNNGLS